MQPSHDEAHRHAPCGTPMVVCPKPSGECSWVAWRLAGRGDPRRADSGQVHGVKVDVIHPVSSDSDLDVLAKRAFRAPVSWGRNLAIARQA